MKILIVYGTRPCIIKLVSVIKELEKTKGINLVKVNTGQHREMTKELEDLFKIKPDYNLNIMKKKQSLSYIVTKCVSLLDKVIHKEKPNYIIVLGDTSTALAGALAGFNNKVPVIHIEAGVRSQDQNNPYPEEMNRRLITQLSTYHLCQSNEHLDNLIKEGKTGIVVGNTGADAIKMIKKPNKKKNLVLVTMHRRENWGTNMKDICNEISCLAFYEPKYKFIVLCHPNPIVYNIVKKSLDSLPNLKIKTHMRYDKFIKTLASAKLIISDSGSIGMEAPILKTPIMIIRKFYENPIVEKLNLGKVVGCTKDDKIFGKIYEILINKKKLKEMTKNKLPYSDGKAGKRTVKFIKTLRSKK
jgi:UDP-N-acetylglucosamine 2-epimerase (non-hydrolysing)